MRGSPCMFGLRGGRSFPESAESGPGSGSDAWRYL